MKRKKTVVLIISLSAFLCAAVMYCVVFASNGPATDSDPIITKSYIDSVVLPQVYQYIDAKNSGSSSFEIVSVSKGKSLIADSGCELIVRMGSGSIIATAQGGISDVTIGADLQNSAVIPLNHHLIVPVSDGRGLKFSSEALVMVKGSYSIK